MIGFVTALTFRGALGNQWLNWDDPINITENPYLELPADEFGRWAFTNVAYVLRYKPLNWLVWYAARDLYGTSPRIFHGLNIGAHVCAAVLLFIFLRQLAEFACRAGRITAADSQNTLRLDQRSYWRTEFAAFVGSAWWALHPTRAEPVSWVSGFGYPLAACFFFGALCVYFRQGGAIGKSQFTVWFPALTLCTLSLVAYPAALSGAWVFFVLDLAACALQRAKLSTVFGQWRTKGLFFLLPCVLGIVTVRTRTSSSAGWSDAPTVVELGVGQRLGHALLSGWDLIQREMVPAHLHVLYGEVGDRVHDFTALATAALGLLAVTLLGVVTFRKQPLVGMGFISFLLLILPYLGWTEEHVYSSERYSYIASLGLAAAVTGVVGTSLRGSVVGRGLILAFMGLIVIGAYRAASRAADWKDDLTFFQNAWESPIGGLRATVARRQSEAFVKAGRRSDALHAADAAVEFSTGGDEHLRWRANLRLSAGLVNAARSDFQRLANENPPPRGAHGALAYFAMQDGDWKTVEKESLAELEIESESSDPFANQQRQTSWALLAMAHHREGRASARDTVLRSLQHAGRLSQTADNLLKQFRASLDPAKDADLLDLLDRMLGLH